MGKKKSSKNMSCKTKNSDKAKFSTESYKNKIILFLRKSGKKPIPLKELAAKCRSSRGSDHNFSAAIDELTAEGVIHQRRRGFVLCEVLGFFPAEVARLSRTFGFLKKLDDDTEIFVPGKFLCGAMTGDTVLARYIESRTGSPEGEVIDVLKTAPSRLAGVIAEEDGTQFFLPDSMSKSLIRIINDNDAVYKTGDKVLAELAFRGKRHSEHKVRIIFSFGSAQRAESCAHALILAEGVEPDFPENVKREAKKIAAAGIWEYDFKERLDLREEKIFTIDSAESKDLDDAVSIEKTSQGYTLGVHIADVSHYVKANSPLDKEAMERGTSIYYADKVIPMLPKELSNGICSLNPGEDRLTFSAIMKLTTDGKLKSYKFEKSVIRSKVKGVYSEINTILDGTAKSDIKEKYKELEESIFTMNELADILMQNRRKRGSPNIETSETKLVIGENGICSDILPRTRGKSEMIIEEFMLLANESAAKLAKAADIPFVYRIHEQPAEEKISNLREVLTKLNISIPHFSEIKPAHMAQILDDAKELPLYPVVNMMMLRSMAKAKYDPKPVGHFGLALEDYSHFTSPIRRYPDLSIHRILTDITAGANKEWLDKRYTGFAAKSSEHSSQMEVRAMKIERECEDCYKAEYMQQHIGEVFEGLISSVTEFGFYVELPNTAEGLVHVNSLPEGCYSYDGYFMLMDEFSDRKFCVGDKVKVMCSRCDVNSGKIDFELE